MVRVQKIEKGGKGSTWLLLFDEKEIKGSRCAHCHDPIHAAQSIYFCQATKKCFHRSHYINSYGETIRVPECGGSINHSDFCGIAKVG